MDDESVLTFDKVLENLEYDHAKDLKSVNKLSNPLLALPADENEDESVGLRGEGVKIIVPSNIIDKWFRLEVLLGSKFSGHTDTLTDASNLIDDLYKRDKTQTEQHYQNDFDKFTTN